MSYIRYMRSLLYFRHPRLSYFDNFTPAYTRPIVANNVYAVYAILVLFGAFEVRNYRRAVASHQKGIQIPK